MPRAPGTCISLDDIIDAISDNIDSLDKLTIEETCGNAWILQSGLFVVTEKMTPEHYKIIPPEMRRRIHRHYPDVSADAIALWIMLGHFRAVRLAINALNFMENKKITRKQHDSIEDYIYSLSPEDLENFEGFFVELIGETSPFDVKGKGNVESKENVRIIGSQGETVEEINYFLRMHGLFD